MSNPVVHDHFRLNGNSFLSSEELLSYAKSKEPSIHLFLTQWFDDNDTVEVFTSGSTGTPSKITLKKQQIKNSALATGTFFDLKQGSKALLCLSPDYIAGKMMLVRALVLGWQLDVTEPASYPLKETKKKYDFCAMVPLQLANSLAELSKIGIVLVGGGPVSKELVSKLQNLDTKVYASYGMTETITHIAVKPLNQTHGKSYYRTLPHSTISTDHRGCLVIDAPLITPEKVITNDLVSLKSDREFEWLGRYDHVINSGGIKLYPEQIEDKMAEVIVERFFVAGIPDEKLGERLVLIIEKKAALNNVEISEILGKLKSLKLLTKYEIPKEVYFLPKFKETETKKIQRRKTLDLIL